MYEKGKNLLKEIEAKKNNKERFRPRTVVMFLYENKIVFVDSIYKAMTNPIKKVAYYDIVANLVKSSNMFDFYRTGYKEDFGIKLESANAIIAAIEQTGRKVNRKELLFLDKDDYKMFIENGIGEIDYKAVKSQSYIQEKSVDVKYYKGIHKVKPSIADIIEGFRMENVRSDNEDELKVKNILDILGIKYEFQKVFYIGSKFFIADFYVPENNVIIEVDGAYHKESGRFVKDRERDIAFAKHGILTLRFDSSDPFFLYEVREVVTKLLIK